MTKLWTTVGTFMFLSLFSPLTQAEIIHKTLLPQETNAKAKTYRGPHQIYWNTELQNDSLLITLGGTNSLPSDYKAFTEVAVAKGYAAIGIDYDNHVISTTCKAHSDDLCFDRFRREVVVGNSRSSLLNVDADNSILQRIHDTLSLLALYEPAHFAQFIQNEQIQWQKIVVAGHSQGSGHAAYLSKLVPLKGVLLFAGPQDRFESEERKVNWVHQPGLTESTRYFAFIHKRDFFGAEGQIRVAKHLMQGVKDFEQHFIITEDSTRDPHMSVIFPEFTKEWNELLERVP